MTKREAAIVAAYTGVMVGTFSDLLAYAETLLGEGIGALSLAAFAPVLKKRAYADFMALEVRDDDR